MPLPSIPSSLDHLAACREIDEWVGPRRIYPISFAIPEELVLSGPPAKEQSSGEGISRGNRKYRFGPGEQDAYYADYQRSYFGLTYKKGGWDCMRHLEIMANGTLRDTAVYSIIEGEWPAVRTNLEWKLAQPRP